MKRITQLFLPALLALQVFGALLLISAFYIRLWPLELLVSFTGFLVVVLFFSLVVSTGFLISSKYHRRSWPSLLLASVGWVACFYIVFYSFHIQQTIRTAPSAEPTVTFATLNTLYSNHDTDRYIDYFREQNVDIIALQEMLPSEAGYVAEELGFEYSYSTRPFATAGGTAAAIVSRYPFESVSTVELDTNHPIVRAVVKMPDGSNVAAYSVHLPVPSSSFLYDKRNITFQSLTEKLSQDPLPVIIGGDFNTTVYSPLMRSFVTDVSPLLRHVIAGNPPECSWYGYGQPLCIRIDHIFVSNDAHVTEHFIGPNLGSDHRPVVVRMAL